MQSEIPVRFLKRGRGTEEGGDGTEVRADAGSSASPRESARVPMPAFEAGNGSGWDSREPPTPGSLSGAWRDK